MEHTAPDGQKVIPFNSPYLTGKETDYILRAAHTHKHLSGNGFFTKRAHAFFRERYGFKNVLLTSSCTAALEMSAILMDIRPGDEVIMPAYTFVTTANAFVLRGAKVIFADSSPTHPNIDPEKIPPLITPKTKAIVVVHYAGTSCDMDAILAVAAKHKLFVVEDAAQAIDSFYKGKPLGSFGHFAAFSFHETKNIQCGEGGLLVINDQKYAERAEIIWEKGTNRAAFFRGEISKYEWVDLGSSFLPSDMNAAFLCAQLEGLEKIQKIRKNIWNLYFCGLKNLEKNKKIKLPALPKYATNNAHIFYLLCNTPEERSALINYMQKHQIHAIFHYQCLHKSPFYRQHCRNAALPNAEYFESCLLRLPFYVSLSVSDIDYVLDKLRGFFGD